MCQIINEKHTIREAISHSNIIDVNVGLWSSGSGHGWWSLGIKDTVLRLMVLNFKELRTQFSN